MDRAPRRLVLVRHAKAEGGEEGADHDRRLTSRGERDAEATASWLGQHLTSLDHVWVSSARRAQQTWAALQSEDPRPLAAIARSGTAALPLMAPALLRHLRELPSAENGLALTEQLVLQILSEQDNPTLNEVFWKLVKERDPLPYLGDTGVARYVSGMGSVADPPFVRTWETPGERSFRNRLKITSAGLALLRGERDWQTFNPPSRWVGGVLVHSGAGAGWRWNERTREPVLAGDGTAGHGDPGRRLSYGLSEPPGD